MTYDVLTVHSSGRTEGSYSRLLVEEFIDLLRAHGAIASLTIRDLTEDPVPTLGHDTLDAIRSFTPDITQREAARLSEDLIDEIKAADLLVMGVPMYNWGIPAALKAWIDQIVRFGYTFGHGSSGIKGLLGGGKPALVVLTRGGLYSTPEKSAYDFQRPYLEHVLTALDLQAEFVICEGTLLAEGTVQRSLAESRSALDRLAKKYA